MPSVSIYISNKTSSQCAWKLSCYVKQIVLDAAACVVHMSARISATEHLSMKQRVKKRLKCFFPAWPMRSTDATVPTRIHFCNYGDETGRLCILRSRARMAMSPLARDQSRVFSVPTRRDATRRRVAAAIRPLSRVS